MASGDTIAIANWHSAAFPGSGQASIQRRNGHMLIGFNDNGDDKVDFEFIMPQHYAGTTGVTVYIYWISGTGGVNGDVIWDISFERHEDDAFDLDSDGFAAANSVTDAAASVVGEISVASVAFTDGADMDSVAAGESFRMRVSRDADNASDTHTGGAQIVRVEIRET